MPKTRLFELLIKLRADQLDRETAWQKAVQTRAEAIVQRARTSLTDKQRDLVAQVEAGRLPAIGLNAADGRWIDGLKEIDKQAYLFYRHHSDPGSTSNLMLAENELEKEDTTEWRRRAGDRFLDNGVWRFRKTPWHFVLDKLKAERGMPFAEEELFEAVRHVQLEEAEKVDLAIRNLIMQQDDSGYTYELLAGLWSRFPADAEAMALEKPEAAAQRSNEMTLAQASREYGVPSWKLSRAGKKPTSKVGHLPTRQVGSNVLVTRENARAFAKTYDAEREQRTVGSLSNDEEARNVVASLKKIPKSSPRRKRAKS